MEFVLGGLVLPVNPEKLEVATDAKVQSWSVLDLGDVAFPRGMQPAQISFECLLPGAARQELPIVRGWQPPEAIVRTIANWQHAGRTVRFVVTDTPINLDVFIERFAYTASGGFGDVQAELRLTEARLLVIPTDGEAAAVMSGTTGAPSGNNRQAPVTPSTYAVRSGDTLWAIAKRVYGDGSRWREIYDANAAMLGPDPTVLTPGQELRIPGGGQ